MKRERTDETELVKNAQSGDRDVAVWGMVAEAARAEREERRAATERLAGRVMMRVRMGVKEEKQATGRRFHEIWNHLRWVPALGLLGLILAAGMMLHGGGREGATLQMATAPSLSESVAAAPAGGTVKVEEGRIAESIRITKPLRLER